MTQAWAFELPLYNQDAVSRLVSAVPPNWAWITGQLDAPLQKVANGQTSIGGYLLDRHELRIDVATGDYRARWWDLSEGMRASITMARREAGLELMLQHKQPQFVHFYEAGFDQTQTGMFPVGSVKEMIIHYVRLGYLGDLFFYSDCVDDSAVKNPESVDLHLSPYTARWHRFDNSMPKVIPHSQLVAAQAAGDRKRVREILDNNDPPKQQYPALIKIEVDKKFGGKVARVQGLLDVCASLGLKKITGAADIQYGTSYLDKGM